METLFNTVSFTLFAAAIATIISVVHDVRGHLDKQDHASFRAFPRFPNVNFNRALGNAWKEHIRLFPESCKRLLFACFLIAACVSVMAYPVWMALSLR